MTKKEQYHNLLNMPQTAPCRTELVDYDEEILKDVYTYLLETDQKKTMRIWIRQELETRIKLREEPTLRKGSSGEYWARRWAEQWEEARKSIRKKAGSGLLQRIVIARGRAK